MKVLNIIHDSIVDGEGLRTVIFFAGCPHLCLGCHNPHSWNPENGREMTLDVVLGEVKGNELSNVTFSGGEPFIQTKALIPLARKIKALGKTIWCYTGYEFEKLLEIKYAVELLKHIDVLVDGKFELDKRDLCLLFRGSSNQRIIKVKDSLLAGEVVLY